LITTGASALTNRAVVVGSILGASSADFSFLFEQSPEKTITDRRQIEKALKKDYLEINFFFK